MLRIVHQLIAFLLPHWHWNAMRRQHRLQSYILRKKALHGSYDSQHPFLLDGSHNPIPQLNLLERRLVESGTTIVIPFDNRVFVVRSLNRAQFPIWFPEVAQTLDSISWSQFRVGCTGLTERWLLGTI
jgi:hypothetical protein